MLLNIPIVFLEEVMAAKKKSNSGSANAAEKRVMDKKKLVSNYLIAQDQIAETGERNSSRSASVMKASIPMYKKYNVKSDKEITPAKYKALLGDLKKLEMAAQKVKNRRGR
jgi:hypothetical protein